MTLDNRRFDIVIASELTPGQATNLVGHLSAQFGAAHPEVGGPPLADAAEKVHSGLPALPGTLS